MSLRNLEDLKEKREGSSSPMLSDKETDISNPKKVDVSSAYDDDDDGNNCLLALLVDGGFGENG